MFVEKVEEKEKKETPKGWTPFGLEEEVDGVLGTVAKTVPPWVVAAADVAVVAVADAAVVAAAVAVVVAAEVVVVFVAARGPEVPITSGRGMPKAFPLVAFSLSSGTLAHPSRLRGKHQPFPLAAATRDHHGLGRLLGRRFLHHQRRLRLATCLLGHDNFAPLTSFGLSSFPLGRVLAGGGLLDE